MRTCSALVLLLLAASLAAAEPSDTQPALIALRVHPIAQRPPALRNHLLPVAAEQIDGDAGPLLHIASELMLRGQTQADRDAIVALLDAPLERMDLDKAAKAVRSPTMDAE